MRQQVSREMHPTPLMPRPLERTPQCRDQPGMLVTDDQSDTGQAASLQLSEEAAPEHLVLTVPDIEAWGYHPLAGADLTRTLGGDPRATTTAIEVTCEEELRTCR